MANTELLSEYADLPALRKQTDIFISYLAELETAYNRLKQAEIGLSGSSNKGKDITTGIREAQAATNSFAASTKQATAEFKSLLALSKQNAVDLKAKNTELSNQQKELTLSITKAKEETRLKAISEKEAATTAKKAADEAQQAATQRILSLKQEEAEQQKIAQQEAARIKNQAVNENRVENFTRPAFIASNDSEKEALSLQKNKTALAALLNQRKIYTSALKDGTITQADHDAKVTASVIKEQQYRIAIQGSSAELKKLQQAEALEGSELKAKQLQLAALIREYGLYNKVQRESVNGQAKLSQIQALNKEVLSLEVATGKAQRNVGNYGNAIANGFSKAYGLVRTLANILPGLGISGIFLLAYEGITALISALSEGTKKIDVFKENYKNMIEVVATANKEAGKQTADLKILYGAATDVNNSMTDRLAAVKALQKEFPDYFSKLNTETILNGDAKKSYDELSLSIIASSRAKAAKGKIDELEARKLDSDFQKQKIKNATAKETARAQAGPDVQGTTATDEFGNALETAIITKADKVAEIAKRKAKALAFEQKKQDAADAEIRFLTQFVGVKNLEKAVTDEQTKGAKDRSDRIKAIEESDYTVKEKRAIEYLEAIAKNEDYALNDRLAKRQEAYDIEKALATKEFNDKIKFEQSKQNEVISDPTASANAKINAGNAYRSAEKKLTEEYNDNIEQLEIDKNNNLDQIRRQAANKALADLKKERDEAIKFLGDEGQARAELLKKQADDAENAFNRRTNFLAEGRDIELKALEIKKNKGIISVTEYEKEKLKIENDYNRLSLLAQLDYTEEYLKILKQSGKDTSAAEAKIAATRLALTKQNNAETLQAANEHKKELEKTLADIQKVFSDFAPIIQGALDAGFTKQKNDLQDLIDLGEKKKQADIEAINATTLSEQDKAAKIAIVNARSAAQKEQLELRQRQLQERAAKFQKAQQIAQIAISGAAATVAALGMLPYSPANIAAAIYTGALAAAQLAVAIATPIPKYRYGTQDHKGGPAVVGDGGKRELVLNPDGSGFVTPDTATVMDLQPHARVYPDIDKLDQVRLHTSYKAVVMPPANNDGKLINTMLQVNKSNSKHLRSIKDAITSKPTAIIRNTLGGWKTGYESNQQYMEWVNRINW